MRADTRLFLLAVVVLTTSCSFVQPLPDNWKLPPPEQGAQCPDISGHYLSTAEVAGKESPRNLFDELQSGWAKPKGFIFSEPLVDPGWKGEHEIEIEMVNGPNVTLVAPDPDWKIPHEVVISPANAGQLALRYKPVTGTLLKKTALTMENGHFYCQDGWLRTQVKIYNAPIPTTLTRSFVKVEGYLLEKLESRTFNVLGFPGYAQGVAWFRYAPIPKAIMKRPAYNTRLVEQACTLSSACTYL